MQASTASKPFQQLGWLYEPRLNGLRCIAIIRNGKATLYSRKGVDLTSQYPAIARGIASAVAMDAVVDGEIVALDEEGKPSFQLLQQRMNLTNSEDISKAEVEVPAIYFACDLIYLNRYDLMKVTLEQRKSLLEQIVLPCTHVQVTFHFVGDGQQVLQACKLHGFEGIVAKRLDSHYEPGKRSAGWVDIRTQQTSEFVVAGYTVGQGDRNSTFGALLLGHFDPRGELLYVGSVGSGFTEKTLAETSTLLSSLRVNECPFKTRPADKPNAVWLSPGVVAEVRFTGWSSERKLRGPVFSRFRSDLKPAEIKVLRSVRV